MNIQQLIQGVILLALSGLTSWIYSINQTVTRLEYTTSTASEVAGIRLRLGNIEYSMKQIAEILKEKEQPQ